MSHSQPPRPGEESLPAPDVTQLLHAVAAGNQNARNALFEAIYACLRGMAQQRMREERAGHTLQPTALVNEAYLRLLGKPDAAWENRGHFLRAAADAMRKILIDHARRRNANKRGSGKAALSIAGLADVAAEENPDGFLALDGAISRLEELNAQAAEIVRLRFFCGLTERETAETLGMSQRTVHRDWTFARGWLRDALQHE